MVTDVDGFKLEFEEDVGEAERKFYEKAYPNVDLVVDRRIHCTSCGVHIGSAPVNETVVRMHPVLKVTHCRKCHTFYNSGEFSKGEDGSELYCRWCGQGGEVYCCSSCPFVFCKRCITTNLSRGCVNDISKNDNWNCFSCAPKIMWHLRAQHWALVNYMEKTKKKLVDDNLSESELNIAMNKDLSSCCKKDKTKSGITPEPIKSNAFQPARSRKRTASSSSSITPPPSKKNGGIDGSAVLPQLLITDQPTKSEAEVVCTPDILSMFEQDAVQPTEQPPALVRHYAPSYQQQQQKQQQQILLQQQQRQTVIAPVAIQPKRPAGPLSARSLSIQAPATTAPVYHRINGFKVDLNIAAQQETYRLPNGKLIQVKKQTPALVPTSNPRPQINVPVRPILHNRNLPVAPTLLNVRYNNVNSGNLNAVINNVSQNFVPPTIKPSNHGNTPLGQARTMFEGKVFASMDVCKHIMGKIQALTNSSAYKTVKSYNDLKELHIHLSYLFTYAIGRFKTLQDTGTEDMKKLGLVIDATNAALNDNSDDDDLQIIEPHTTLIELDSDGEDTLRHDPPVPALTKIMQLPSSVTVTKKMVPVPKPSPTPSNTSLTELEIPMPEMLFDDDKLKMITRVMLTKCDDSSVLNMKKKFKKLLENDKENINEEEIVSEKLLNGSSDKVCDSEVVEKEGDKEVKENVEKDSEENEVTEKPLDESVNAEVAEKIDTSEVVATDSPYESMEVDEEVASNSSTKEEKESAEILPIDDDLKDKEKVIERNCETDEKQLEKEPEIDEKKLDDKEEDENGDADEKQLEKKPDIDEKKVDEKEADEEKEEVKEIEADDEISTKDDEETSQDSKSTQDDEKTETENTSEDSSSLESSEKLIETVKPSIVLSDIIASGLNELVPNKFEGNSLTSNT